MLGWEPALALQRQEFLDFLGKKGVALSELSAESLFLEKRLESLSEGLQGTVARLLRQDFEEPQEQLLALAQSTVDRLNRAFVMRSLTRGLSTLLSEEDWLSVLDAEDRSEAMLQLDKLKKIKRKRRFKIYCQICFDGRREQMNELRTCQCGIKFHAACFSSHGSIKNECQICCEKARQSHGREKLCQYCGVKGYPVKAAFVD